MRPNSMWLFALLLGTFGQQQPMLLAQAQELNRVDCPAEQTTFLATTELVFEGRSELLSEEERVEIKKELMTIYNKLTAEKCDAFFRKMQDVEFIRMTNNLNETLTPQRRNLQATTNVSATNTSVVPSISLIYKVNGSCRNCVTSTTGSFELYDDAFRFRGRRHLTTMRVLEVRELQTTTTDKEDCVCETGKTPTTPQAPGVRECVDLMNNGIDSVRETKGLFDNVRLENLLQLDDLTGMSTSSGISSRTLYWTVVVAMPLLWGWMLVE